MKCIEEMKSGNMEFSKAKENLFKEICSFDMDEVVYFIQNCLPSFELSLDELN
ncbi:MAG: YfbR-like 5'-deoxynucleotidase [Lachnospiraceae bacterium]